MSAKEIEEKREATKVFVEHHIKRGYFALLSPKTLADIAALEQSGAISYKSAVFLMHYYMVKAWFETRPQEWCEEVKGMLNLI